MGRVEVEFNLPLVLVLSTLYPRLKLKMCTGYLRAKTLAVYIIVARKVSRKCIRETNISAGVRLFSLLLLLLYIDEPNTEHRPYYIIWERKELGRQPQMYCLKDMLIRLDHLWLQTHY